MLDNSDRRFCTGREREDCMVSIADLKQLNVVQMRRDRKGKVIGCHRFEHGDEIVEERLFATILSLESF